MNDDIDTSLYYMPQIKKIFDDKNWPLGFSSGKDIFFERFCKLFSQLDFPSCDMMLSLMKDFLWIKSADYDHLLYDLFAEIDRRFSNTHGRVYICPMKSSNNDTKNKSCDVLFYKAAAYEGYIPDEFPNLNLGFIDNSHSSKLNKIDKNDELILIDDFIGTGNSALKAKWSYMESSHMPSDKIHFYCFVCLEIGYEAIRSEGNDVFYFHKMNKGISDRIDGNKELYKKLMTQIEEKIPVSEDNRFGYGHSEALVKVMNTPNNTFPVFWKETPGNPYAPFPRRKR